MQIQTFEKIIDVVWNKYDTENKGYIEGQQCNVLIKSTLEQQGYSEYYKQDLVDKTIAMVSKNDGKITKRQAAEAVN